MKKTEYDVIPCYPYGMRVPRKMNTAFIYVQWVGGAIFAAGLVVCSLLRAYAG